MKNKKMMATLTCFVVAMAIVGCTSSKSPDTNKQKEATTESVTVESNLENSLTQNNDGTLETKYFMCTDVKVSEKTHRVMYIKFDEYKEK